MKKTFTVNLGGRVFQIDEDAYQLLDNYLNNLKYHFRQEDDGAEIVKDIESRISELFMERLSPNKEVITITDVEEVILQMGKPEDITDDKDNVDNEEEEEKEETKIKSIKKKLFRDPEDKLIGGVCSGIAAYAGCDVTAVRLLAIILSFGLYGSLFFVYLICWFIIPLARTTADKLAMRGLEANLENIGKTVTNEANKGQDKQTEKAPKNIFEKFLSILIMILVVIFKVLLVVILLCCTPFIFVIFAVCFALLMAGTGIAMSIPSFMLHSFPILSSDMLSMSPSNTILIAVTGIMVVLLPIAGLIYAILRQMGKVKHISTIAKTVLLIIWSVSLGLWIYGIHYYATYF